MTLLKVGPGTYRATGDDGRECVVVLPLWVVALFGDESESALDFVRQGAVEYFDGAREASGEVTL